MNITVLLFNRYGKKKGVEALLGCAHPGKTTTRTAGHGLRLGRNAGCRSPAVIAVHGSDPVGVNLRKRGKGCQGKGCQVLSFAYFIHAISTTFKEYIIVLELKLR